MAPGPVHNAGAICFTAGPKSCRRSSQGGDETRNLGRSQSQLTFLRFSIRDTFLRTVANSAQNYVTAAGRHARIHTDLLFGGKQKV